MKDEFSSPSLLLLTVRSFQCSGIGTKHLHHFIIELFQLTNSRALNDDVILPTLDANTNQICDFFFFDFSFTAVSFVVCVASRCPA